MNKPNSIDPVIQMPQISETQMDGMIRAIGDKSDMSSFHLTKNEVMASHCLRFGTPRRNQQGTGAFKRLKSPYVSSSGE